MHKHRSELGQEGVRSVEELVFAHPRDTLADLVFGVARNLIKFLLLFRLRFCGTANFLR